MNSLRDRVANLEARTRKCTEKEWRELCEREGLTPERMRTVIQLALEEVGPDDPSAPMFRDALKQLEEADATG